MVEGKDAGSSESVEGAVPPLSIVAVDDDADFREFLHTVLDAEGHDLRTAADPAMLWEACEDRLPDVVLLDMKMGDADGQEVLAELRRRWPKLCVIVVTGYPTMDSMRETFKKDVFDYVPKPFSTEDLSRVLGQAAAAFNLGGRPQDRLRSELGRQVRLSRTRRGWTLKDLSEASGVSVSQLSSIERGAHLPSVESLLSIAGALDEKPSVWFGSAGF